MKSSTKNELTSEYYAADKTSPVVINLWLIDYTLRLTTPA